MQDWNDEDLARFRAPIKARLRVLSDDTARGCGGEATVTLDPQVIGRFSRMDALQNQAMARAQQARRAAEATRLAAALDRIDSGDDG